MEIVLLIIIFMVLLVLIPLMLNKRAVMHVIKRLRQQQALDIQRLPLQPDLECGCGQDVIQQHRQLETILFGKEGVHIKDTQL